MKKCANCQDRGESRAMILGLCRKCYMYQRRHGEPRPEYMSLKQCKSCGIDLERNSCSLGLCSRCYEYQRRTGRDRSSYLIELDERRGRIAASNRAKQKQNWCSICGALHVHCLNMCVACYYYFIRNNKNRPRHLWDDEAICGNCKRPLANQTKSCGGYCRRCYDYRYRTKRDRPSHLWGMGDCGWCECGQPANDKIEGIPVCQSCFALERSEY